VTRRHPRSGTERVCLGSRIHGIERRVLGFLDRALGEIDGVECVRLGYGGVRRSLLRVESGLLVLDVCPYLGDMGLPFAPDLLPLRRRLIVGGICLVFELIGSCSRFISRAATSVSS
jgi:hypothetical protein